MSAVPFFVKRIATIKAQLEADLDVDATPNPFGKAVATLEMMVEDILTVVDDLEPHAANELIAGCLLTRHLLLRMARESGVLHRSH